MYFVNNDSDRVIGGAPKSRWAWGLPWRYVRYVLHRQDVRIVLLMQTTLPIRD